MKSFIVSEKENGIRLNRYLMKHVPKLGGSEMYKCLRLKKIKLNGKKCEASARLASGDVIDIYLQDTYFESDDYALDFMKASKKITVVYEDDNIAVVYKPAGILVHADKTEYNDTLINRYLRHLYDEGEYDPSDPFTPQLCNRLDRGTSGLVVIARNSEALTEADAIIKDRFVDKYYLCITVAKPPKDGVYDAYLRKNEKLNKVEITDVPLHGSKDIHTGIKTVKAKNGLWLVEIDLITGRPHQIRAHLSSLGAPILGDEKYGNVSFNKKYDIRRQALCSYKLVFSKNLGKFKKLNYLQGKVIEFNDIWFVEKYFGSEK